MQPSETKTAFLTVDVDSKAQPQKYRMDLRLDWTQSNNSLDETLTVELDARAAEVPVPLIAVGLVLIALVAVVVLRRRRKSRSPA
jgi:LPXTG-motif cell wall-anchored protein